MVVGIYCGHVSHTRLAAGARFQVYVHFITIDVGGPRALRTPPPSNGASVLPKTGKYHCRQFPTSVGKANTVDVGEKVFTLLPGR